MAKYKKNLYIKSILKSLLDNEIIVIKKISENLEISDKTIRTKIKQINEVLKSEGLGVIKTKPSKGIWLQASDEQKIKLTQLINDRDEIDIINGNKSRKFTVLKIIFNKSMNGKITTKQIADQLYLSQPTVLKTIQEVKEWLHQYDVELSIERNEGIKLVANEMSYRIAVKHFISRLGEKNEVEENISYLMPSVDVKYVKKIIISTEKLWQLEFAEESFNDVLIYVALAISRNKIGKKIKIDKDELKLLESYTEYNFANSLFSKCKEFMDIDIDENDLGFLSIQILCSKVLDVDHEVNAKKILIDFNNKLGAFIEKIILVISNVLNVDLTKDDDLRNGLLMHLRPCIFRLRYNRGQNSKLTKLIKNEYQGTFRISWIVSVLFEEYFGLKVTEDELSYIVIYIQTALERNSVPLKAVLVTSSGMGINQLLSEKIKKQFKQISDIRIISFHDFYLEKEKDMDIIITTNDLGKDKKIVQVDEMLSENSIQKVEMKLTELLINENSNTLKFDVICHSLFEPDLIFCNIDVDTKEESIKIMCDALLKKGYITSSYFKTVLERESKNPTAIGNYCATPHGDQKEINESKVCVATLKKPIEWDTEKVALIFLMVVRTNNPHEIKKTQLFCKEYLKLIETSEDVSKLRAINSNIDFYKYLIK